MQWREGPCYMDIIASRDLPTKKNTTTDERSNLEMKSEINDQVTFSLPPPSPPLLSAQLQPQPSLVQVDLVEKLLLQGKREKT